MSLYLDRSDSLNAWRYQFAFIYHLGQAWSYMPNRQKNTTLIETSIVIGLKIVYRWSRMQSALDGSVISGKPEVYLKISQW